jgi:tetratricopeptide (TPR) repeat protein
MKFRESALIFFLVLSSFAANVVAPTKAELEAIYATAARELNAGHYSEALKQLDAIEARQADLAAVQNLRGVVLMRMGEYGKAETALRKAREIDPGFWEARFNLAEVPFLKKDWAEARHRFEALAAGPGEQLQGVTGDVIQFKILLTFVLEGKAKMGAKILDQFKASPESPALYYARAALALRQKNEKEAKIWMTNAGKEFSPHLNRLFAESFYETGWLPKPDGATPVALEVTSSAERVARAQADFATAQRAFKKRDFARALNLLNQVDATAPNQAISYNLRGEILLEEGKYVEAEAALRAALTADPQFQEARYNLARVPFKKRDYEGSRKQLEALLGATSGGRQQQQRGELIRYQIFLTLLLEGRESAAQKAMDEFKMMDDTPALYYAQAAWAFQHGNSKQGNNWVANASNLYSAELNRSFSASFADLGWLNNAEAQPVPTQAALAGTDAASLGTPSPAPSPGEGRIAFTPVVAETASVEPVATPELATAPARPAEESPASVLVKADAASATPSPTATLGASATLEAVAGAGTEESRRREAASTHAKRKRSVRAKSTTEESRDASRSKSVAARSEETEPTAAPSNATPVPALNAVGERPHQNLGDKVARLLLYPFKHQGDKASKPAPGAPDRAESANGKVNRPSQPQPKN